MQVVYKLISEAVVTPDMVAQLCVPSVAYADRDRKPSKLFSSESLPLLEFISVLNRGVPPFYGAIVAIHTPTKPDKPHHALPHLAIPCAPWPCSEAPLAGQQPLGHSAPSLLPDPSPPRASRDPALPKASWECKFELVLSHVAKDFKKKGTDMGGEKFFTRLGFHGSNSEKTRLLSRAQYHEVEPARVKGPLPSS